MDEWSVSAYKEMGGEETPMFTATIMRNGKAVGRASNSGHGGANSYCGKNSYGIDGFCEAAQKWAEQFGYKHAFEADSLWIDWYVKHRPYGVTARAYLAELNNMISA